MHVYILCFHVYAYMYMCMYVVSSTHMYKRLDNENITILVDVHDFTTASHHPPLHIGTGADTHIDYF